MWSLPQFNLRGVGWLAAWPAGWLAGGLAGCLVCSDLLSCGMSGAGVLQKGVRGKPEVSCCSREGQTGAAACDKMASECGRGRRSRCLKEILLRCLQNKRPRRARGGGKRGQKEGGRGEGKEGGHSGRCYRAAGVYCRWTKFGE